MLVGDFFFDVRDDQKILFVVVGKGEGSKDEES